MCLFLAGMSLSVLLKHMLILKMCLSPGEFEGKLCLTAPMAWVLHLLWCACGWPFKSTIDSPLWAENGHSHLCWDCQVITICKLCILYPLSGVEVLLMKQWTLNIVCFLVLSRLVLGFDLLVFVFGKFPVVFCTWLCMFSATVIVPYKLFIWWAQGYCSSSHRAIHSLFYGMLFTLFQTAGLGFGPTYIAVSYTLPPASRFIVILEQVGP